ncbi:MAG: NADP-dependent isocitrate dehydrogenase [Verrucomicrobiales bacterium]
MAETPTIIYTLTDEAPALATRSLLPIIQAFTSQPVFEWRRAGYFAGWPDHFKFSGVSDG